MLQYIDTQKKELCCGCRACEQICHVHAIIMKEDEEGFLYPHLNMNLCTQCGLCEKVCPNFRADPGVVRDCEYAGLCSNDA